MNFTSIALSGLPCSGKTTLCEQLSCSLNWNKFSIGDFFREEYQAWKSKNQKLISFEEYWAHEVTSAEIYRINDKARELLKRGKIILDSRYAGINARDLDSALLIFLTCPIKIRAEHSIQKYPEKALEDIKQILEQRKNEELKRGRELYSSIFQNYDYAAPDFFHLVLNTGKLTINDEKNLILNIIRGA